MRRVLQELPPAPATVLDLGVGTGRELAALQDARYAPTGVDVSPAMLERCARRGRPVPLVEADFWQPLPFPDGAFDAAIALHGSLAHPPQDAALRSLAKELARVVKTGGVWIAEAPSPAWLDGLPTLPMPAGQRITRTGSSTCRIEDAVVSTAIEARVYSEPTWREALAPWWEAKVEADGAFEWVVVAHRR